MLVDDVITGDSVEAPSDPVPVLLEVYVSTDVPVVVTSDLTILVWLKSWLEVCNVGLDTKDDAVFDVLASSLLV